MAQRTDFCDRKAPYTMEYYCQALVALGDRFEHWIGFAPIRPVECPIRELTAEELAGAGKEGRHA